MVKTLKNLFYSLMVLALVLNASAVRAQDGASPADPGKAGMLYIPIALNNAVPPKPAPKPLLIRQLVITTDAAEAAAAGVKVATKCRVFDPVSTVSASSGEQLQSVCITHHTGFALICSKDENPLLCSMIAGDWFSSPWQADDQNLPVMKQESLSDILNTRTCPSDPSKPCTFVSSTIEPSAGESNFQTGDAAQMKLNASRAMASRELEASRLGKPWPIHKAAAVTAALYGQPNLFPYVRGTLGELCGSYLPPSDVLYVSVVQTTIQNGQVWLRLRFFFDAEGRGYDIYTNGCLEAHDAEWTTFQSWQSLLFLEDWNIVSDKVDEKGKLFETSTLQVGVGTDWGPAPEMEGVTIVAVAEVGIGIAILILEGLAAGGATFVP